MTRSSASYRDFFSPLTVLGQRVFPVVTLTALIVANLVVFSGPSVASESAQVQVEAGVDYTCVLVAGQVTCVGDNEYGQLGDGTTT